MFIETIPNNGKPYLRLVHAVRKPNKDGKMVSSKQILLNIGPLDRFDDGQPDYLERLRRSFKAGNPLIPELQPFCSEQTPTEKYSFTIEEGSDDCIGHSYLVSNLLMEKILEETGLRNFFSSYKNFLKIKYDVYGFAKLLIFGRVLHPASKCATVRQNDDYFEPILKDGFNPDNVYDTLSFIYDNKDRIIRRINTDLVKKAHRSPHVIYYDVTNFYFETEEPDDDILDDNGNVITKGLRKMGVSKEKRSQPIVQMGMFMDDDGIPISIEAFSGNALDQTTLRPALEKNIDDLDLSRFILIGDRGICSYKNLLHVKDTGNGYIVSKSLLKCPRSERDWAYSDNNYIKVSDDFKYKARIVKRTAPDEKGISRTFDEMVVVFWSRKLRDRELAQNKSFVEFLKKLEESPNNFRITSLQAKNIKRFFKKECLNENTGEILDSTKIKPLVDFDKAREYVDQLGYYQIVTSELTMEPVEVIDKYHGLKQIEDQFRVMKGTLETRPMYVRTPEHIEAHLIICLIALIVTRLIQKRVADYEKPEQEKKNDLYWSYAISADRLQEALNKWKVESLPNGLYRFVDTNDPDLKRILDAFGIEIPKKLYTRAELKQIKTGTSIFK